MKDTETVLQCKLRIAGLGLWLVCLTFSHSHALECAPRHFVRAANVDRRTDEVVQHLLRTRFADRTVLTIAHRMLTILDSTKILAMERGRAVQFGAPLDLCRPLQQLAEHEARFSLDGGAPAAAATSVEALGLVASLAHESKIAYADVVAVNGKAQ